LKEYIREFCKLVIENLDTLEVYEKRTLWKKKVSNLRKHLTENKSKPSVEEIYPVLFAIQLPQRIHFLKQPQDHAYKPEYAKLIMSGLTFIEDYVAPGGPHHHDYGPALSIGNAKTWVDQFGYNIFDTEVQRKHADLTLIHYERRHGKPLYKPEVRKSDPVGGRIEVGS
jgi:hypothetical protein